MNSRNRNNILFLVLGLLLLCSGCGSGNEDTSDLQIIGDDYTDSVEETQTEITEETETETETETEEMELDSYDTTADMISVYICGAVNQPGVYELSKGDRIYHAIEKAGGMTEEAMETYLNLAEELEDGVKIYVPTKEEVEEGVVSDTAVDVFISGNSDVESSGLININTASKEELMTLTGIGESKAESIIDYRETNGDFNSVEDVQNITGIKEGVYSQIVDDITVD